MAEEEEVLVVAAASPKPSSDHKRKLDEFELKKELILEQPPITSGEVQVSNADPDAANEVADVSPDESDAKRPRLDDSSARANGHQEKLDDTPKENADEELKESQPAFVDLTETAVDEQQNDTNGETSDAEKHSAEDYAADGAQEPPQVGGDTILEQPEQGDTLPVEKENTDALSVEKEQGDALPVELEQGDTLSGQQEQGDAFSAEQDQLSENETVTHRMEVPNNKVGVLIGKAGDTIRYLQYNSRAKIQITRDAEADPNAATRPVEITGSLESISKAEKLINAVIAEADAGGSPSLVARGVATAQAVAAAEQIQIQVSNEKVGLIIGRMGDTIKSLQAKTGARIQLIPQHPPKGDESKEANRHGQGIDKGSYESGADFELVGFKHADWLLPCPWGQHGLDNNYSFSSTEERYQAYNSRLQDS